MVKYVSTAIVMCLLWSLGGFAQTLNISKHRYVENRYIEVLWNAGSIDGLLLIRNPECSSCASHSYTFSQSLEVSFMGRKFSAAKMRNWSTFTGDVILTKGDEKLIAVKRYN